MEPKNKNTTTTGKHIMIKNKIKDNNQLIKIQIKEFYEIKTQKYDCKIFMPDIMGLWFWNPRTGKYMILDL